MRVPTHLIAFVAGLGVAWAVQPAAARKDQAPGPTATVTTLDSAVHRRTPSDKAGILELARGASAFVGRLDLAAGGAVPEHTDPTEEYIHVLTGAGVITIDGEQHPLSAGSTVFMPAGATVSYTNGDAPMVAIQVFAGAESADKYASWPVSEAAPR